jgi:hypothetical protein
MLVSFYETRNSFRSTEVIQYKGNGVRLYYHFSIRRRSSNCKAVPLPWAAGTHSPTFPALHEDEPMLFAGRVRKPEQMVMLDLGSLEFVRLTDDVLRQLRRF